MHTSVYGDDTTIYPVLLLISSDDTRLSYQTLAEYTARASVLLGVHGMLCVNNTDSLSLCCRL